LINKGFWKIKCQSRERVIYVTSSAGPFTPTQVEKIQARAIVVGASMRNEVSLQVIEELAKKKTILSADVQSFIPTLTLAS